MIGLRKALRPLGGGGGGGGASGMAWLFPRLVILDGTTHALLAQTVQRKIEPLLEIAGWGWAEQAERNGKG